MEVKIKGLKGIEDRLLEYLKDIETDPGITEKLGEIATNYIKGSVKAGAEEYRTDPVTPETQNARTSLAKHNTTDPAYRKSKALTFTGELINSLTFKVKDRIATLFFDGTHKQYQGKHGPIGKAQKNSDIAAWVQEKRPFLFLSGKLKKRLSAEVVREVRRKISLYQKLRRKIGAETND